jgi:ATP-dependent DNA ligase
VGDVGGKAVVTGRAVSEGKNLGRANATTPLQQALAEAAAKWKRRVEEGYAPSVGGAPQAAAPAQAQVQAPAPTAAKRGGRARPLPTAAAADGDGAAAPDAVIHAPGQPLLPMLAHDYRKRAHDARFPCYAQKKLDGVRCLVVPDPAAPSGIALLSRRGKPFPHLEHLRAPLAALLAAGVPVPRLDGELYSDTLSFQDVVGTVRRTSQKAGDAERGRAIHLCVYDAVVDGGFAERLATLTAFFGAHGAAFGSSIRLLATDECPDAAAVRPLHDAYVAAGYEGIMLRNRAGAYHVGARSANLLKFKVFLDEEYPVVGFLQGEGVEAGLVIWTCVATTPGGERTFNVRPRGSHEERRALFAHASEYVGRKLTVRFQELTEDGLPRFPVGVAFRDYE